MMMETESLRRHCHIDQFSEDLSLISCLAPILPTLDPHSLGVGGGGKKKKALQYFSALEVGFHN